jgi:hypothetical protein
MENSFNRAALGTYVDISDQSEKYGDLNQSNILEKLGKIQKKDLFFILSVNSFGLFVIIYFLLYLFL